MRGLGPFILFGVIVRSALLARRGGSPGKQFSRHLGCELRIACLLELPLHLPLHAEALVIGQRQLISHAVREFGRLLTSRALKSCLNDGIAAAGLFHDHLNEVQFA